MKITRNNAVKTALTLTVLGFIVLNNVPKAQAQTTAITNIVAPVTGAIGVDYLFGWEFNVNSNINVSHLGIFDLGQDGLNGSHLIGIFRASDGVLLTPSGTTVSTANPLDGTTGFRYQAITPTLLTPGQNYRIAALYQGAAPDAYIFNHTSYSGAGEINVVSGKFLQTGVFTNPTGGTSGDRPFLSTNFKFTSATAAPEPGTLALIAMGGVGFAGRLRSRRKLAKIA
jgi:hypothetical protein